MTHCNEQPPRSDGIVIAGGGLAGQRCAETLRRDGYDGAIRIVCAEPHRPYDRPPLSKELLAGTQPRRPAGVPTAASGTTSTSIELLLGVAATAVRPGERRLELSDGGSAALRRSC